MTALDEHGPEHPTGDGGLAIELDLAQARLRELDHRIKNDLQLIASVYVLQARKLPEGEARAAIRGALERLNAVAAVHRRLDVGGDAARFEASVLVRDVAEEVAGAARRDDVRLTLALTPVSVPSRQAAPLALITGELVRNALRHGFPGRGGQVAVSLGAVDGAVELGVRDDGVGLGGQAPGGFGATLCALLAQQLRGRLDIVDDPPGVRAAVRFPPSP
jgi:two-component sensor histidine kinase